MTSSEPPSWISFAIRVRRRISSVPRPARRLAPPTVPSARAVKSTWSAGDQVGQARSGRDLPARQRRFVRMATPLRRVGSFRMLEDAGRSAGGEGGKALGTTPRRPRPRARRGQGTAASEKTTAEDARAVQSREERPLDIVLFGATGFAGRLTAGYLARHAPRAFASGWAGDPNRGCRAFARRSAGRPRPGRSLWPTRTIPGR
jgi:hypothetical protein